MLILFSRGQQSSVERTSYINLVCYLVHCKRIHLSRLAGASLLSCCSHQQACTAVPKDARVHFYFLIVQSRGKTWKARPAYYTYKVLLLYPNKTTWTKINFSVSCSVTCLCLYLPEAETESDSESERKTELSYIMIVQNSSLLANLVIRLAFLFVSFSGLELLEGTSPT